MQKHQDEAEGNSCKSTALTTERRISHRATETNLPKFVTAPNKTPLGRPTWPSTIDHTKPSAEWTRTALKLPPPWPVEDARWCEVTASGSVSRFYASDRLTPPQIATLESKRRQAAILSRKPGATILNSAITWDSTHGACQETGQIHLILATSCASARYYAHLEGQTLPVALITITAAAITLKNQPE